MPHGFPAKSYSQSTSPGPVIATDAAGSGKKAATRASAELVGAPKNKAVGKRSGAAKKAKAVQDKRKIEPSNPLIE